MKTALLIGLLFTQLPLSAFAADNEEILRNSQALLEQARKQDEERRRRINNVDLFNPQKTSDQKSPSSPKVDIKNPDDLLKHMEQNHEKSKRYN